MTTPAPLRALRPGLMSGFAHSAGRVLPGLAGALLFGSAALSPSPAQAWSDHPLGTFAAIRSMPEVTGAPEVEVETFAAFVEKEQTGLELLLQNEEAWARTNLQNYPPRPDELAFKAMSAEASAAPGALPTQQRVLRALRWNPESKLGLYVERLPGDPTPNDNPMPWQEVTTLKSDLRVQQTSYARLQPGMKVQAMQVVGSASDEPDYGMDINVWQDSPSAYGKDYGFGPLPFGNPKLEYATQAPFHMGLFHEANIVYKLASFTKRTFPEMRVREALALARFAFKTGHPYWGWRFTGWGLHYIQDLTQPYHARLLPGVSVPRMLWINTLSMIGIKGPRDNAVQKLTNRHLALENYQYHLMESLYQQGKRNDALFEAAASLKSDAGMPTIDAGYVRTVLTEETNSRANHTDKTLEKHVPKRLISDPKYLFEQTEPDIDMVKVMSQSKPADRDALNTLLNELFSSFGKHSRNFIRAALKAE